MSSSLRFLSYFEGQKTAAITYMVVSSSFEGEQHMSVFTPAPYSSAVWGLVGRQRVTWASGHGAPGRPVSVQWCLRAGRETHCFSVSDLDTPSAQRISSFSSRTNVAQQPAGDSF